NGPHVIPDVPLPWERLLWSGRPLRFWGPLRREEYCLTDFRLVRASAPRGARTAQIDELALSDIIDINVSESGVDRLLGTSTVVVKAKRRTVGPMLLSAIRHGPQLAAFIEVLASEPHTTIDARVVSAALQWEPPPLSSAGYREATGALIAVLTAITAVILSLPGTNATVTSAADDRISPKGARRDRPQTSRFMEPEVMPWAGEPLGRNKGGPERITCETCRGPRPDTRGGQMPAVAALPEPEVKER